MTKIKSQIGSLLCLSAYVILLCLSTSCSESQSYSELLREEEKATNLFLAGQKVINEIPADSTSFITGKDAPFYRLDPDGYVYMQVIRKGDTERVQAGDIVYFRFNRLNLLEQYNGYEPEWQGNSDNILNNSLSIGNTYFMYKNTYLESTTTWGTGIQMPLKFFGYNSEVNLVLRSYYGFAEDQTYCIPYLINLRYFKPEY